MDRDSFKVVLRNIFEKSEGVCAQALKRRAIDLVSGETGQPFSEIWRALNAQPATTGGEGSEWLKTAVENKIRALDAQGYPFSILKDEEQLEDFICHIIHCRAMDIVAEVEGISSEELNAQLWGQPAAEVMSNREAKRRLTMVSAATEMVRQEGCPYTGASALARLRRSVGLKKATTME